MLNKYRQAIIDCWKCAEKIPVFTWEDHKEWQEERPPEPVPNIVQFRFSSAIGKEYWVNVCPYCRGIQGDWYLYDEPDGPFYDDKFHIDDLFPALKDQ